MNTELKNALKAADQEAQYDTSAKRLLGQKSILAHILVKTVDEFHGMDPKDDLVGSYRWKGNLDLLNIVMIGRAEGVAQVILSMYRKGFTAEQIAEITEKAVEEVEALIAVKGTS